MNYSEMLKSILDRNPEIANDVFLLIIAKQLERIGKEIEQFVQTGGLL